MDQQLRCVERDPEYDCKVIEFLAKTQNVRQAKHFIESIQLFLSVNAHTCPSAENGMGNVYIYKPRLISGVKSATVYFLHRQDGSLLLCDLRVVFDGSGG